MRLGIPVATRQLRFGDPYYPCPQGCETGTYYDGSNGVCYDCSRKFLTLPPRPDNSLILRVEPKKLKRILAILIILILALSVTRERGKSTF